MTTIYFAILAIGILAIVFILLNENKSQKASPVDLLNSLDVDENSDITKPSTKTSESFLNRLSMDNNKTKAETPEPISSPKEPLGKPSSGFETKIKDLNESQNPENHI